MFARTAPCVMCLCHLFILHECTALSRARIFITMTTQHIHHHLGRLPPPPACARTTPYRDNPTPPASGFDAASELEPCQHREC